MGGLGGAGAPPMAEMGRCWLCVRMAQPPIKLTELLMIANNVQNSSGSDRWLIAQPTPPNLK